MKIMKNDVKTALIEEWKERGSSAQSFCKEKGIKPTTFYGWIKRNKKTKLSEFVEISKKQEKVKNSEIILEKGDVKIHIPASMLGSELKMIFKALDI